MTHPKITVTIICQPAKSEHDVKQIIQISHLASGGHGKNT